MPLHSNPTNHFCGLWFCVLLTLHETVRVHPGWILRHTVGITCIAVFFCSVIMWFMFSCEKETNGKKYKYIERDCGIYWNKFDVCAHGLYGWTWRIWEHPFCISIYSINYNKKTTKVERILFNSDFGLPFIITLWFLVSRFSIPFVRHHRLQILSNYRISFCAMPWIENKQTRERKKNGNLFLCPEFICISVNWNTIFAFRGGCFISRL